LVDAFGAAPGKTIGFAPERLIDYGPLQEGQKELAIR